MYNFQTKTGSESHTTEWRSAAVTVNGEPIYQSKIVKKIAKDEWEDIGNKGKHGKWCVSRYAIPEGARVEFVAKANGREPIEFSFIVGDGQKVDVDGYTYRQDICGWIVGVDC